MNEFMILFVAVMVVLAVVAVVEMVGAVNQMVEEYEAEKKRRAKELFDVKIEKSNALVREAEVIDEMRFEADSEDAKRQLEDMAREVWREVEKLRAEAYHRCTISR